MKKCFMVLAAAVLAASPLMATRRCFPRRSPAPAQLFGHEPKKEDRPAAHRQVLDANDILCRTRSCTSPTPTPAVTTYIVGERHFPFPSLQATLDYEVYSEQYNNQKAAQDWSASSTIAPRFTNLKNHAKARASNPAPSTREALIKSRFLRAPRVPRGSRFCRR